MDRQCKSILKEIETELEKMHKAGTEGARIASAILHAFEATVKEVNGHIKVYKSGCREKAVSKSKKKKQKRMSQKTREALIEEYQKEDYIKKFQI